MNPPLATFALFPIIDGKCGCRNPKCNNAGKHPAVSNWQKSQPGPVPSGSYGIVTGVISGIVVIDLDVRSNKHGVKSWYALIGAKEMPDTHTTVTGGLGLHLRFKCPDFLVKNSTNKLGPGIDVRGEGGYIVGPGSAHKSGRTYVVKHDVEPAEMPGWLQDLLRADVKVVLDTENPALVETRSSEVPPPVVPSDVPDCPLSQELRIRLARESLVARGGAVSGDGGSGYTMGVISRAVRFFGLTTEEMALAAVEDWNERCEPPWSEEELQRKVQEALTSSTMAWDVAWMSLYEETVAKAGGLFRRTGWSERLPPVQYLIEGLITRGSVTMFVAHGDSMKTWLVLSMATSVSSGKPWLGRYPVRQGRVGFLDYENGYYEVHRRMRILQEDGSTMMYEFGERSLMEPGFWKEIEELGLDLLVVDSLAAGSWGVDENSTQAHAPLQLAKKVGEKNGMATKFIHHARKGDGKSDKRQDVRGASAIFAACDAVYAISNELGEGKAKMLAIKTRQGKKPLPVTVQLTDRGGVEWYEDVAGEAAHKAETPPALEDAVKLLLVTSADGVAGNREIAAKLRKRYADVVQAMGILKERREVVRVGERWFLDSAKARVDRVVRAIAANPEIESPGMLASAASVSMGDVQDMERAGKIMKCVNGYRNVTQERHINGAALLE